MRPQPYMRPSILIYTKNVGRSEVVLMIQREMALGKLVKEQKRVFN
jgi:hypothetical protein